MAENTKIEWAHHTFNPWIGCTKVSPACDHCYAEKERASTALGVKWGANMPRHHTSAENWKKPIRWNAAAEPLGVRHRVFCASLADVFDNEVPAEWRDDLATLINRTPHLEWLLLTKRIGNAGDMLRQMFPNWAPTNIRIGASITTQDEANRDIHKLLRLGLPNFLSMEPLLGPVDLERPRPGPDLDQGGGRMICQPWLIQSGIDWIIVGGESGPNARPMHPDWARSLRDQCQATGVPFMFKQWGEWAPSVYGMWHHPIHGGPEFAPRANGKDTLQLDECFGAVRIGKKAAGRLLDGRTWDEVPA